VQDLKAGDVLTRDNVRQSARFRFATKISGTGSGYYREARC